MRKMKDSCIPWVGEMPADWDVRRGKFTLKLLSRSINETDDIITCFRDGEVTLRKNRREDGFTVSLKEIGYQGIEPGDLVIHGMDGFAGSIGISDSRGKSSPVLVVCDSNENKKYIMYYLRSMAYNDVFTALATGIRVRSCDLRWNKLAELPYILPSINEQKAIVEVIDSKIIKIDGLIANIKTQIEKLKAFKQSLITEVVTKGLDPKVPMKDSGVEWIGEIPEEWGLNRIKYTSTYNDEALSDSYDPDTEIEYVEIGSVNIEDGVKSTEVMLFRNAPSRARRIARKGDIIVSTVRTYLKAIALIEKEKYIVSTGFCVIRPQGIINNKFYKYFCSSEAFTNQVSACSVGISYPAINASTLVDFHIVCPQTEEQYEISSFLDKKCAQIDDLITLKKSKIEKLEQYKKSLIFEYVTGKKEV